VTGGCSQNLNKVTVTVTVTDLQQHKSVGFTSSMQFLFFQFNFVHGWIMKERAVSDSSWKSAGSTLYTISINIE